MQRLSIWHQLRRQTTEFWKRANPLALIIDCSHWPWVWHVKRIYEKKPSVRCSLRTVIRKDLHPVYRVWGFILILDGSVKQQLHKLVLADRSRKPDSPKSLWDQWSTNYESFWKSLFSTYFWEKSFDRTWGYAKAVIEVEQKQNTKSLVGHTTSWLGEVVLNLK